MSNLTADEGAQLENIGTTTISAAQWGYVGGLTAAKVIDWSTSQQFDDIHPNNQHSAGTNLTLSGTTLNVDDAFLKNDANDTTTGTITAAGFTTTGSIGRDAHNQIKFSTDDQIIFRVGDADGVIFKASGEIEATKFDGALEGNADTATSAGTIAVVPNDALNAGTYRDENNLIPFIAEGDSGASAGTHALESADEFHYNPNTKILTVEKIASSLTGDVTGTATNASAITLGGHLISDVDIGTESVSYTHLTLPTNREV